MPADSSKTVPEATSVLTTLLATGYARYACRWYVPLQTEGIYVNTELIRHIQYQCYLAVKSLAK